MAFCRTVLLCLAVAVFAFAGHPKAAKLYEEGLVAERSGDVVRAYLLYSEAAALDTTDQRYWVRARSLEGPATVKQARQKAAALLMKPRVSKPSSEQPTEEPLPGITAEDLAEVARLRPPPELKPRTHRQHLELRGTNKQIFEQAAGAFGLEVVFDGEYQTGANIHLVLDDVDYRETLRAVQAATESFAFPLSERLIMVAKDTQQKRTENEPTIAITVPIPETVTPQEAQELGRAVQQTMDILKVGIDPTRRMVLMKDRMSKVLPARALFEQLAHSRPEVVIEMRFLEVDRTSSVAYGLLLPNSFPIVNILNGDKSTLIRLSQFLMTHKMLGIGVADAQMFATMSRNSANLLLESSIRALDGSAATLHVGNKYPIKTAEVLGDTKNDVLPSFTFEDLGLSMKVTPRVHGNEEVTLELDAEFKVLGGQTSNGIPYISNRKLQSKVRVRNNEWAVVSGLIDSNDTRAISGFAGLSDIPFIGRALRKNTHDQTRSDVLILLRPILLNPAPEQSGKTLWVGTEGRLGIPL